MPILSGPQLKKLREAIVSHYQPSEFLMFLQDHLNKALHLEINTAQSFTFQVFDILNRANTGRWYEDLLVFLIKDKPHAKEFGYLAYDIKLKGTLYKDDPGQVLVSSALEAMVNNDPLFDPNLLISKILEKKRCICRIELQTDNSTVFGTGFLIAPDLVLTNYHVLQDMMKSPEQVRNASCKFDYELVAGDQQSMNSGTNILFSPNSILAYSSHSESDEIGSHDINELPWPMDKLDYAVIRLDREMGKESVPYLLSSENNQTIERGWIKATQSADPVTYRHIIIMQHPNAQPVKIAFGFDKFQASSSNKTRIRYRVNTMAGSSGAPCFDHNFNWIALHNMGDPQWNPSYNQGVSAFSIIDDLKSKGINI